MHGHLWKTWPALLFLLAISSAWAEDHRISVGGMDGGYYGGALLAFTPSAIDAHVGDTVTFVNLGYAPHNVVADDGSFRCANGCDGAGGDGTPSAAGWTSTITLNNAGDLHFHCEVHGSMGMVGVIHVAEATGGGGGHVPITSAFTGAWYDPQQSGHGIFIEVLPNNQILAWWFTFTPDGQQAWFGNVGSINGDEATVAAVQTEGGRWIPNFNPANVTQPVWGTLTFQFTDCNHGEVNFAGTGAYGTGHMDLTRLTQPAGLACP